MEHAGRADAERTMALLWDGLPSPRRGPRARLDLPAVLDAAIAQADRAGLAELSMRALAKTLAIGTASLYTYIPGRAELLDLMIERQTARRPPPPPPGTGWREGLRRVALDDLDACWTALKMPISRALIRR
jgi:AcrR family transcriptional regulator